MNVVVVNQEPVAADIGQGNAIQSRILHIDDTLTGQANEMMMLMCLRIEPGGGTRMTHLGHHARSHQHLQDAIDGSPRDSRQPDLYRGVDLVGRGMVLTPANGFKHRPTMDRQRQASLAANPP